MFEVLIYAIIMSGYSAFGYELYKEYYENIAYAECSNVTYHFKDDHKDVYGTYHFNIKNDKPTVEKFTATYTVCPMNLPCVSESETVNVNPFKQYHSKVWNLYAKFNQKTTGTYTYRVITDVKGYKNLHTENTCKVRIVHG